jgi:predicted small metal-binding protein
MRELHCADAGFDCEGTIRAETDDEVMEQAAAHVASAHPGTDLDADAQVKIRSLIHEAH